MKSILFLIPLLLLPSLHANLIPLGDHVDGRFSFVNGAWDFVIYLDSENESFAPDSVYLPLSDKPPSISGARINRSANANFQFIGVDAGIPFWVAVQGTPGVGEAWPGFTNTQPINLFRSYIPADARVSQTTARPWIKVSLANYRPPLGKTSHFSMWTTGTTPIVWMSTFLTTGTDDYYFAVGDHNHVNWGFTAQGVHMVTFQASAILASGTPTPVSAPQTMIFAVGTIGRWQADAFTKADLENPNVSGLLADPDRDGHTNLIEYAFGMRPKSGSPSTTPAGLGLPKYSIANIGGVRHHVLTYPRRKAGSRLQPDTYTPQFSANLGSDWTNTGFAVSTAAFSAPLTGLNADWEIVTAMRPILEGEPAGFCRVAVQAGDGF